MTDDERKREAMKRLGFVPGSMFRAYTVRGTRDDGAVKWFWWATDKLGEVDLTKVDRDDWNGPFDTQEEAQRDATRTVSYFLDTNCVLDERPEKLN